ESADQARILSSSQFASRFRRFDGALAIAVLRVGACRHEPGAVVVGQSKRWIEANRLVVIRERLVVLLLPGRGEAAVAIREGILWIEADCLVVIRDRLVVVFFAGPGEAADVVG